MHSCSENNFPLEIISVSYYEVKFFLQKNLKVKSLMWPCKINHSYILMFSVASVMLVARDEHSDPNAENGDTDREDEVGV